ncbi:ScbR family autoregulator-binding transcription factor [Streptomyces sp. NPDC051561]|uniref:ScbR family autoregulator-binding transcription factor n=1 Tax=Streptomyces sp. NPDC051561 TaxID=3365658 RepID=UPI0037AF5731
MQERAVRTRRALVRAAASEFDRYGYDGTSMLKVSRAAGITTGALTFHFSTKSELADAVQDYGRMALRTIIEQVTATSAPPLDQLVDLTLQVARLLEEDPAVRSAARLTREHSGTAPAWSTTWLPTVHELLHQAQRAGHLHTEVHATTLASLASHLLTGTEVHARAAVESNRPSTAVVQLQQIWKIALRGIRPGGN